MHFYIDFSILKKKGFKFFFQKKLILVNKALRILMPSYKQIRQRFFRDFEKTSLFFQHSFCTYLRNATISVAL